MRPDTMRTVGFSGGSNHDRSLPGLNRVWNRVSQAGDEPGWIQVRYQHGRADRPACRVDKPTRPWIGAIAAESNGDVVVVSVAPDGPAAEGGLKGGEMSFPKFATKRSAVWPTFIGKSGTAARRGRKIRSGSFAKAARPG
jgi:S1-C subfamily serine protease